MKVVAVSDLHGFLPGQLPEGDVLCICGDTVPLEYQNNLVESVAWFCLNFVPWTDSLSFSKVIFIGGNHDFFLQEIHNNNKRTPSEVLKKLLPGNNKSKHKLIYLKDNSVEIGGKVFYGMPWITGLPRWAFNLAEEELEEKCKQIPKRMDVFMSHLPPAFGEVGTVLQAVPYIDYGNAILAEALKERQFKYAISGHVHTGAHYPFSLDETRKAVNVSMLNEDYLLTYPAFTFEI